MGNSHYSMHYNASRKCWIVKYKKIGGNDWGTKWMSRKVQSEAEATQLFLTWYSSYLNNGVGIPAKNLASTKTLRILAPKVLEIIRDKHHRSSQNYYRGTKSVIESWILDNPKHPHLSIQDLDCETDFNNDVIRAWIKSIPLDYGSVYNIVSTARRIFTILKKNECFSKGFASPFDTEVVVEQIKDLRSLKNRSRLDEEGYELISYLEADELNTLVNSQSEEVPRFRQVLYFTLATLGLRVNEAFALTWNDIVFNAPVPYVRVSKQLLKSGMKPAIKIEEARRERISREDIMSGMQAVISAPKWDEFRRIPLHSELIKCLEWWKQEGWLDAVGLKPSSDDPVFPRTKKVSNRGWFQRPQAINEYLDEDLKSLGLPTERNGQKLTMHSFRHTFATLLRLSGVSEGDIEDLLGHKRKSSTANKHYIDRLNDAHLKHRISLVNLLPVQFAPQEYNKINKAC